ncbi:MAG: protein kinase domain-containing protein [Gemmatimonadota bacterium]
MSEIESLERVLDGQYELVREIGRGGMGIVFLARDLKLDRLVAIKTLPGHLVRDPSVRDRFLREARTAAALSHPHVVPIHRADEIEEVVFFVMGYVPGPSVAQLLKEGGLDSGRTVSILTDVASALAYAHGRGVIHRDIKAENILIDGDGRALVTDFGIARLAESAVMTATGQVLGTVHYMSPEQVSGERLDGRSDLYATGVLAFLMLSGRFPFESDVSSAVLVAHVTRPAPRLRDVAPSVHPAIASIVDQLLEKNPAARPATADELESMLDELPKEALALPKPDGDRVISAEDAARIWERAAVLQHATGQHPPPADGNAREPLAPASATSGYSLDQVRAAADGVGIERRYVDRALSERGTAGRQPSVEGVISEGAAMSEAVNPFYGAPSRLEYEVILDGELPDDAIEDLVDEIRRTVGEVGHVSTVGRTVTFAATRHHPGTDTQRQLQVTVSLRQGRTTLRAFEDLRQYSNGILWGITGGAGAGLGAAAFGLVVGNQGHIAVALPVALAVAGAAYAAGRLILVAGVRRKAAFLRNLLGRLSERVRELGGGADTPRSRRRLSR